MPSDRQISEALLIESLTGFGADTRTGMVEIDLPDSQSASWAWATGVGRIEQAMSKLSSAVAASDTEVVSVFALAPIPLLAYLGSLLDDKYEVRLFPRQRRDDVLAWTWPPSPASAPRFESNVCFSHIATRDARDVVVTISISAPVKIDNMPTSLREFPLLSLQTENAAMGVEIIDSKAALSNFASAWRGALTRIEESWPRCERIHVLAAVPTTVAVQLGRNRMNTAQPELVVYQLTNDGYENAVTIT